MINHPVEGRQMGDPVQTEPARRNLVVFAVFFGLIVLIIVGNVIFHPREEVFGYEDGTYLETELNAIKKSTSSWGTWGPTDVTHRTGLTVSANLTVSKEREAAIRAIDDALASRDWIGTVAQRSAAAARCKGRYRAGIWVLDTSTIGVSLFVKRLKAQKDC